MSAVLEAPIMTEDTETRKVMPPDFPGDAPSVDLASTTFGKTDGFLAGDSFGDPSATPAPRGGFFPLPDGLGRGAAPPEANAATSQDSCRTAQPRIPPSPGAALLEEFDPLYHKYQKRVYRQCFRMLGNQEDAEDLTQEVFLQLFRKAHTFRGEANFSTWLYRLTVNTVLMQLRRRRRWQAAVTSMDVAPGAKEGLSDVLTMLNALPQPANATLDKVSLEVAIAQLPSGYQEIYFLHDVEGYQHDEIAKLLGISEGTSKSQLHKARLRLRALIGPGVSGSPDSRSVGFHRAPAVRNARRKRCHASRPAECVAT